MLSIKLDKVNIWSDDPLLFFSEIVCAHYNMEINWYVLENLPQFFWGL